METAGRHPRLFDTGAPNGPVENINGKLEHFRGIDLEFMNKANYILRSLIHSGGIRETINALRNRKSHCSCEKGSRKLPSTG